MIPIQFSKHEQEAIVKKIQAYCVKELDHEVSRFEAEFLLDFFAKELSVYFYNQGVSDAQAALSKKVEEISDAIADLEKPTEFRR